MLQRLLQVMGLASEPLPMPRIEYRRSPMWGRVRADHLDEFPTCAACGRRRRLEVHHVKPFHLFPALELEPSNLLTLCEDEVISCHLLVGHAGAWTAWNPHARADAALLLERRRGRLYGADGEVMPACDE